MRFSASGRQLITWTVWVLDEVEAYTQNYYGQLKERATGRGAIQVLVDRYTGRAMPGMGPNMTWNNKYGMMGGGIMERPRGSRSTAPATGSSRMCTAGGGPGMPDCPPDPAASFAPERVKCACLDCSATFLWVPESLQLYHAPACQQRARIERRHTPAAIRAKAEYDHQRYLARKPQLNHARNERRRRAWLAVIVAMPPGRPGARPSDASIVAATATTVAANPTPKRTIPDHQASRLRPRSPGRHVGGSMTHAIH